MTAVVSIKDARKAFGDTEVLRGISLEVERGEVVAVIGPSGGGKSTLLRCMTLLENLDGGSLAYGDLEVARPDAAGSVRYVKGDDLKAARGRFGLVFQNYNLFPHMTVMRNITDAPLRVQKRPRPEVEARARELIEKMGLIGCEDKVPCQLSGGQQQRVSIARALALDPELTAEVLGVIKGLAAEHMTMVVVTHEMPFARDVADRIVFMDGGVIVEQGSPEQVLGAARQERTRAFLAGYRT